MLRTTFKCFSVMGNKLPPDQLELYLSLDELLYFEWDPIGVSAMGGGRDEYYSYLPVVFQLCLAQSEPEQIANYLSQVTDYMGLEPDVSGNLSIAKRALELRKSCLS